MTCPTCHGQPGGCATCEGSGVVATSPKRDALAALGVPSHEIQPGDVFEMTLPAVDPVTHRLTGERRVIGRIAVPRASVTIRGGNVGDLQAVTASRTMTPMR